MSKKKKKEIKLFDPVVSKEETRSVITTLKSHFWASGAGVGQVKTFEEKFNKYVGSARLR